jgi:hypothetical protein
MSKGVKLWGLVVGLTVILAIFWGVAVAEQIFEDPRSYEQASQIQENNENQKLLFFDNFSTDSAMWKYIGDAYRDPLNGYVVLTKNINGQVGVIWFNRRITSPFTIDFKYRAGGGSGAEGLTFMFYKQTSYEPSNGGYLGFMNRNGIPISGYAIEFDNWQNDWDPSSNHIALIKDHVNNHLIYVYDPRTGDNLWHNVRVVVNVSEIRVDVDDSTLFTWLGTINTTYGGFGFSAGTGDANNRHIIDNVNITAELVTQDAYEPDDNYSLANYIAVNGTKQTHDFHVPGDQDWLKFNATGDSSYTVETSDLGPASDTYLSLYDTTGTAEIRHDDDSGVGLASKINWYCGDSGTYYIMVRHYSPLVSGPETRYNISVNPTILPARFNDIYSDRGLDTDSDDLYDYLAIDVGINVSNSGNYSVIANLRALNGTHLTENGTYLYLPVGNQNVTVLLDGLDIRTNKINGPFVLDDVRLRDDSGSLVDYRDDPYITHYYNYTDFQRPPAELGRDLRDYGLDIDSNELFDYLVIEKQINVTIAGIYELDGYLYNEAGYWIDSNYNYTYPYLSAGIHNLTLRFSGYKIFNSKSTGNFTVYTDLYGYSTTSPPVYIEPEIIDNSFEEDKNIIGSGLAEINDANISRQDKPLAVSSQQLVGESSWGLLDSAEDITSFYNYTQFEQPPAQFNDLYSDCGLDMDGNGFFDYLAVDVGVNVSKLGYYEISGELYNSTGWYAGGVSNYTTLDVGNQTVQLRFYGPRIWQSRTNSTYDVRNLRLYNESDWSQLDYRNYAYTTNGYNYTDFRPPAVFMPGVKDYGYDENSNELFDYLVIEKQINVTTAGTYELDGDLYNDSGYGIDSNDNYTYLSAGIQNLTLRFRGYRIYYLKSTGNFTVYMSLYGNSTSGLPVSIESEIIAESFVENKNIVEPMLAEINDANISRQDKPLAVSSQQLVGVSSWGLLDSAEDITSFYNYTQFERPPAQFNDKYTDCGLDMDSNGFFEYLAVDVGVNVSKAGYYEISGELYNSTGWYAGWVSNYTTLDVGNQTVQLRFYGARIWQSRTNSTYDVRYLRLYNASDWSQLDYRNYAYTTNWYNYTDFRPPAVFMPGVSDYGYDENSNELFDYLVIEKQINVTTAGYYELDGYLYHDSGYGIDSNYNYTYLSAGIHNLTLRFVGCKIYYLKITGNFTVYMELYGNSTSGLPVSIESEIIEESFVENKNIVEPRLAEINDADISHQDKSLAVSSQQLVGESSWGMLDYTEDITSFYNYTQFEPPIPDAYEPDDNYSMANSIAVDGTRQTHDFHVPGDQDWLKFNATGGNSYTIETSGLGPESDTYLYLYDTTGTVEIKHDDDSGVGLASKLSWYCGDSGTYYIMVRHFSSSAFGPETRYNISVVQVFFDTGTSANPYPSISGTHNGTIRLDETITVGKLYTYPCVGTAGHSEYIAISYSNGTLIAEVSWNGYSGDWHNLTFNNSFTLYANETYNYTIRTGSYPQIIHATSYNATGGRITCSEFMDINGKRHEDWIPAIRLE